MYRSCKSGMKSRTSIPNVQGSYYAGWGMQQAFLRSAQSLSPTVLGFLKWMPELILSSAAFPCLQVASFALMLVSLMYNSCLFVV